MPPAHSLVAAGPATADARLEGSLRHCRTIMQAKARSFAMACRFLPPEARRAAEAMYAVFRTIDDVADSCRSPGDPAAGACLDDWQRWVEAGTPADPHDPIRFGAAWAMGRYPIRREYLLELLDGVRGDLWPRRLVTAAELERYCYQVAATVGLTMAAILGATAPEAQRHAADLGIAMQLTNVIRDVGEDAARGRVYLPGEDMLSSGYSYDRLNAGQVDAAFVDLLRRQIARARAAYRRADAGLALLPADVRFPIRLAAQLYEGILGNVERNNYDVFRRRAHLGRRQKYWLAARLLLQRGAAVES